MYHIKGANGDSVNDNVRERDREKKHYYCFGPSKKTRKNGATDSSGDQEERFSRIPVANLDQKIETSLVRNKKIKIFGLVNGVTSVFFLWLWAAV